VRKVQLALAKEFSSVDINRIVRYFMPDEEQLVEDLGRCGE